MSELTIRSFTSGELMPALRQRADLARYAAGLSLCRNFIVKAQGGADNRPGTRFVGEVKDSSVKERLVPFEFNTEQTYILEFGDQIMRVIKDGAYVLDGVGPAIYEIVTPYLEADLFQINFTQSADTMTLVHPSYAVMDLTRADHDDWTLATVDFASSVTPPQFIGGTTYTITGATQNNPLLITAVNDLSEGDIIFIEDVVGMTELNGNSYKIGVVTGTDFFIKSVTTGHAIDGSGFGAYVSGGTATTSALEETGDGAGDFFKTYRYVVTATDADGVESLQSAQASINTKSLSTTAGVRLTWGAVAGVELYTVYKDTANGTGIYGFIGETLAVTYDDYNIAPDTSRTPPTENLPISSADNYPRAVGYYQQRKIFGGSNNNPQTMWATQIGIYNSMRSSTPARDDDALTFQVASRKVNEIRHVVAVEDLVLLTSGAPYRITEGQDFVMTPSTIGAKPQGETGVSTVRPAIINDVTLFVQSQGTKVRAFDYSVEATRYKGDNLSIMSEHLFKGRTIVDMDYADVPDGVLWCVMSDGTLLGLTYQNEHKVWAWHQHETDGLYESVAVIEEDGRDAAYFIVNRTVDGNTVRYVERLELRHTDSAENAFFVDSGLSYDGAPTTAISGLDHLEGEAVMVLADGNVVKDLTVVSGAITLPRASSVVHVGLSYNSDLITLGIDSAQQTTQGRKKNVAEVNLRFEDTRGGWVGPDLDNLVEIKPRYDSDNYDTIALRTSEQRITIQPDWNDDGLIAIRQLDPLPMSILAITPEFDIGG